MSTADLAIIGIGLGSHLGNAVQAAAAARAGIQRLQPLPGFEVHDPEADEMVPLRGFSAADLTHGFEGIARLLQLGVAALEDLHASTPEVATLRRPGLVILLSSHGLERVSARRQEQEGGDGELAEVDADDEERRAELSDFTSRLALQVPWLKPVKISVLFGEHATVAQAVQQAHAWLEDGSCDGVLLGAIDSTIDPLRLPVFIAGDLLATPGNPHAFTGGEAGAFLLVTTATSKHPLAMLGPVISGTEKKPEDASVLAHVLNQALATAEGGAIDALFLDHTGETWRFATHGHAMTQMTARHPRLAGARSWLIAEQFGELGAATGMVGCILACRSLVRGYAKSGRVLISLSDHDGGRCALVVHSSRVAAS